MAGEIANSIFKPFFIGRDPLYRESIGMNTEWQIDGGIMLLSIVMVLLILIVGFYQLYKLVNHLYKYLGAYRDQVPIYGSSLVYKTPDDYAKEAKEYKDKGFNAYKIHPPGNI